MECNSVAISFLLAGAGADEAKTKRPLAVEDIQMSIFHSLDKVRPVASKGNWDLYGQLVAVVRYRGAPDEVFKGGAPTVDLTVITAKGSVSSHTYKTSVDVEGTDRGQVPKTELLRAGRRVYQ